MLNLKGYVMQTYLAQLHAHMDTHGMTMTLHACTCANMYDITLHKYIQTCAVLYIAHIYISMNSHIHGMALQAQMCVDAH